MTANILVNKICKIKSCLLLVYMMSSALSTCWMCWDNNHEHNYIGFFRIKQLTISTVAHHAFISPLTLNNYYLTKRRKQQNNMCTVWLISSSVCKGFIYKGHSFTNYPSEKDIYSYFTFPRTKLLHFKVINHAVQGLKNSGWYIKLHWQMCRVVVSTASSDLSRMAR